jgi:hypothetical protein
MFCNQWGENFLLSNALPLVENENLLSSTMEKDFSFASPQTSFRSEAEQSFFSFEFFHANVLGRQVVFVVTDFGDLNGL